ncbi:MAG: hypothetical protein UW99_C0057G0006 [Candidatus Collierbacteria bacterium GW2011_GWC2_45_15]|uniref:Uncharacterized protein n=1 Tax=Candidatus Collierbacteria bacterium GW2011_GWC2_45_15 TaxID=1618394 RepID=A0A0G1LKM8_9BACT|nr:MAG: hypothetical protein UW99_C0057G0006 [Candidatus Collierbacteria bacterium GW2011_GWC2_45_15]
MVYSTRLESVRAQALVGSNPTSSALFPDKWCKNIAFPVENLYDLSKMDYIPSGLVFKSLVFYTGDFVADRNNQIDLWPN